MHEIIDIAFDVTKLTAIVMLVAIVIRVFYTYKQRKKKGSDCTLESLLISNDLYGTPYFDEPDFRTAILGHTEDGRIVYSYSKMVEWYMEQNDVDYETSAEYIDYNTIRTIPYMGDKSPIIVYDLIN